LTEKRLPRKRRLAKKGGKANKSSKKKEKDLTPDLSTEQIFKILCEEGLIAVPSEEWPSLDDLICAPNNLSGYMQFSEGNVYPQPNLSDIIEYLKQKYVLPVVSLSQKLQEIDTDDASDPNAADRFAAWPKSLLLTGPRGVGKHALFRGLCRDMGAVVIDLSAHRLTSERFPGKDGLRMLVHLLSKASRLMRPCVLFVDQSDLMFRKKAPKYADGTDARKLKKELPKIIKAFETTDRVLTIGLTDSPWEADVKQMSQTYQDIVCVPKPDFNTRRALLASLFVDSPSAERIVPNLATVSDGHTARDISNALRNCKLKWKSDRAVARSPEAFMREAVRFLSSGEPVDASVEKKFADWLKKTPEGKLVESLQI